MAFEEVKEDFKDLKEYTKSYIDSNVKYYQLLGLKISTEAVIYILMRFIIGFFAMIAFIFISFAVAFAIGEALDNNSLGFLIVGIFYILVIGIVIYFRKDLITKPIIKKFSTIFYSEND